MQYYAIMLSNIMICWYAGMHMILCISSQRLDTRSVSTGISVLYVVLSFFSQFVGCSHWARPRLAASALKALDLSAHLEKGAAVEAEKINPSDMIGHDLI